MSDKPTMKYCPHIECGGKLQPHSLDSATGELDCDGPCSPRRVQMWRDNLKQPTKTETNPLGHIYVLTQAHEPDWEYVCLWTGATDCGYEHCPIHGWPY